MKNVELNRDIIDKIKAKTPDLIREFMQSDLMKMILYSSCVRVDLKGTLIQILLFLSKETGLTLGNIMIKVMNWKKLALKYFAIVNFVLLPYDELEEKKSWYGYFKNIDREGEGKAV